MPTTHTTTRRPSNVSAFTPDPTLYPFTSRWFHSPVGPIHYIDEGEGPVLLFLHGNPDWSFIYREIIADLRGSFRCIALDLPGFGLSVHPPDFSYAPAAHAEVVKSFVPGLHLTGITFVGQDWGGPIGLDVASRHPDRTAGLVVGNTFFRPPSTLPPKVFSFLMGTRFMQKKILSDNFLVRTLIPRMLQGPYPEAVQHHYEAVNTTPEDRAGYAMFPRQIRLAQGWLAELEQRIQRELTHKPLLLFCGRKDPAFRKPGSLDAWRHTFAELTLHELPDARHFFQEDAPADVIAGIRDHFAR